MRVTTVTCDRCKKEVDVRVAQTWNVAVAYACSPSQPDAHYAGKGHRTEWCRPCMVEMGLVGYKEEMEQTPPIFPAPTIEDFIRDIIREEIQAVQR